MTCNNYYIHFCHYPIAAAIISLLTQCLMLSFSNAFIYPVIINPLPSDCYGRRGSYTHSHGVTTTSNLYSKSSGGADDSSSRERKGFGGKGFGSSSSRNSRKLVEALEKTYGEEQTMKYKDIIIDNEAAMSEFFATNAEWHPLFRSIMIAEQTSSNPVVDIQKNNYEAVAAFPILSSVPEGEIVYNEYSPWKKLDAIPTQREKLDVVATWLDSVQKSLVDIPVDERNTEKDDLDMHFINEGKRLLAITRFHVVLNDNPSSSSFELHHRDELFRTCWSELAELRRADQPDTGKTLI